MIKVTHQRRGFSLLEALFSAAIFSVLLGAIGVSTSGSNREQRISAQYLSLMESAALAIHEIRQDMRQLTFVPKKPIDTHSFSASTYKHSIRLRRSVDAAIGGNLHGSTFILVEYRLIPTGKAKGEFFLERTEETVHGDPLPGKQKNKDKKIFRGFVLKTILFQYLPGSATTQPGSVNQSKVTNLLDIVLILKSDMGERGTKGPFLDKDLKLMSTILVQTPDPPVDLDPEYRPILFPVPLEIPPGTDNVTAPIAEDAEGPLTAPSDPDPLPEA